MRSGRAVWWRAAGWWVQDVSGDPGAGVADLQAGILAGCQAWAAGRVGLIDIGVGGLDYQLPATWHGVAGVDRHVDEDLLDVGAHRFPLDRRGFLSHGLFDERGVVGDDGQQVVEIVGDPAGQLTQAFQPLRLMKLAFQPVPLGLVPQPFPLGLQLQPLGHIADGGHDENAFVGVDG